MTCRMPEPREARLRPQFAPLYPGVPPDRWMPAREVNELAAAARLGGTGGAREVVRGRMLDPRHFDFRGGAVRPSGRHTRIMDTHQWRRTGPWWATGIAVQGPVRQACLRPEHAAHYPEIPPGLWFPAQALAGLLAGEPNQERHRADRRMLDPAHFQFRGGVNVARATYTRATDPNGSLSAEGRRGCR